MNSNDLYIIYFLNLFTVYNIILILLASMTIFNFARSLFENLGCGCNCASIRGKKGQKKKIFLLLLYFGKAGPNIDLIYNVNALILYELPLSSFVNISNLSLNSKILS